MSNSTLTSTPEQLRWELALLLLLPQQGEQAVGTETGAEVFHGVLKTQEGRPSVHLPRALLQLRQLTGSFALLSS